MGDLVRVLSDKGIQSFKGYLAEIRNGSTKAPPYELLTDPWSSAKIQWEVEIERRDFDSKLEASRFLYDRFRMLPYLQVDQNIGLWSWLSLYYFELVCPRNENGRRLPGQDCRHIIDLDFRRYYYHLLNGPYNIYKLHKEKAPLLLSGPLYRTSTFYLQLASRQGFVTNKGVMEAANLLYYDFLNGRPKIAALSKKKPGTLFRFIIVIQQLDLTYDLYSMNGEEVLNLLPSEFDEWHPNKL